jgi:hypothetical protein
MNVFGFWASIGYVNYSGKNVVEMKIGKGLLQIT